ncbi:EF-hand calcium-binding domain-containing protein 14 isoform X1 [Macrobrachium rosenbergii]|uniref:EF-hand calcium-binding domain-containing protein 14 isoform X1 n=1 Tax=Macrobrachium rosenbergii TaxID=79674 RepID=UPI0034D487D1
MVSGSYLNNNNNSMSSYKLLDLSGSDSENEVLHFSPVPENPPPQRKKRLKRRERDLLRLSPNQVDEEAARWCGCVSYSMGSGCQPWISSPGEALRSALLLLALTGLSLLTWLALHLQAQLDAAQRITNAVEASSSELPAKFHASHVRLQELEKNQTALWAAVAEVSTNLAAATKRVEQLEADAKTIKDSLSSAPHLSSLPKDVSDLQGSVAKFGSTLQDVQSSLKVVKQEHEKLQIDVKDASSSINNFKHEISVLHNQTAIEAIGGEGGLGATLGETVSKLRHQMEALNLAVSSVNSSLMSHIDDSSTSMQKIESMTQSKGEIHNVTKRLATLEQWRNIIDPDIPDRITNLSTVTNQLQSTIDQQEHLLQNLTQSIAIVKGVERKLEGSQVQLASGVSDLKQQLEKVEHKVVTMEAAANTPAPPASNETHIRKQRLIQAGAERDSRGP